MSAPQARELFEAWWVESGRNVYGYLHLKESFWECWQAARKAAAPIPHLEAYT